MDERERRRMRLTGRASVLAGGRNLYDALPLRGTERLPLIIGLPDDMVADSLRKAEKLGGRAHLIVLDELPGGKVRIRAFHIEFRYKPITGQDEQPEYPVPVNLELGMLMPTIGPDDELTYNIDGSEVKIELFASAVQPRPGPAQALRRLGATALLAYRKVKPDYSKFLIRPVPIPQ